ncbi:hypothetical protein SynA1560_00381 [Synechococcus sp. A15-60]|nr:hypothetical protein SynA1560_00381 [Synechococcus sp. A15-60]
MSALIPIKGLQRCSLSVYKCMIHPLNRARYRMLFGSD